MSDIQRSSKIFAFAKVIGTVNELSPRSGPLVSRVIPPQPNCSPSTSTSSSTSSIEDEPSPNKGDASLKVKVWKGKTSTV